MAFLFKRNPKTPQELVRALTEQSSKLSSSLDNYKRYQDECGRYLKQIKVVIYGDDENEPQPELVAALSREILNSDCLYYLVYKLKHLDFDSRKDVVALFLTLLRRQVGSSVPAVGYLVNTKPEILVLLLKGPENDEVALACGQILRECIKYEDVNKYIIDHPFLWNYFRYMQSPVFEIATDSYTTFHDILTTHKKIVSDFLANNYDRFTTNINTLIQCDNYVTKRQSVRLLAELVLQRQNQYFLNKYFDDTNNLKLVMLLLSDKLKNLRIEGFHIFKFFVAKPKKSQKIQDILIRNRGNFLAFFESFDFSSFNDRNLIEERDYIIGEIEKLPAIERK